MGKLELRIYPDPVLRGKATPVKDIDDSIRKLMADMAETMYISEGVGLAAPQVGSLSQLITVDIGKGLISLANPRIVESDGSEVMEEGCLSLPDIRLEVKRYKRVLVQGIDSNGKEVFIEAEDLLARVFQHEIDHLQGILIIDKIPSAQRQLIRSKLKELERKVQR